MFEFLIKIYNEEKKTRERNPSEYDLNTQRMRFNLEHLDKDIENDLVNFSMAWSIKLLLQIPRPSPQQLLHLNFIYFKGKESFSKYNWTAFMLLGMIIPGLEFGEESIYETSDLTGKKGYIDDFQRISLLNLKKALLKEKGYFSRFGTDSLFEKEFKLKLDGYNIRQFLLRTNSENTEQHFKKAKWQELCSKIKELDDSIDNSTELKPLIDELDINYQEVEEGYTILMFALINNKFHFAEHLLSMGADPLVVNKYDGQASDLIPFDVPIFTLLKGYELIYSAYIGSLVGVKKSIDEGAEINFQGLGGYSALMIAVEQSNAEITEYLLLHDSDLSLTRLDGQGVFELVSNSSVFNLLNEALELSEEEVDEDNENLTEISQNSNSFFSSVSSMLTSVSGIFSWGANKQ